jgi:hypothetical protein
VPGKRLKPGRRNRSTITGLRDGSYGHRVAGCQGVDVVELELNTRAVLRQNCVRVAWRISALIGPPETREVDGGLGSRTVGILAHLPRHGRTQAPAGKLSAEMEALAG